MIILFCGSIAFCAEGVRFNNIFFYDYTKDSIRVGTSEK